MYVVQADKFWNENPENQRRKFKITSFNEGVLLSRNAWSTELRRLS